MNSEPHVWKHSNKQLTDCLTKTDTSGRLITPPARMAAAFSALDEFHGSRGTQGNIAHFRMCLSASGVPDEKTLNEIVTVEVAKHAQARVA